MKTQIISLFILISTLIFFGCKSGNNDKKTETESKEHFEGDGHNHNDHEGHDHEGHNHDDHEGHDHESEGHDHEGESHEGHDHGSADRESSEGHTDEISFSKAQAEAVGLEIETVAPNTFSQVIKTSGQILSSQGDETTIVATSNGVVSFTSASVTEGSAIKAGQAIVTISSKNLLDGDPATKAKIAFETAQKEFQRAEKLVKDQIISDKEFEQIRSNYETSKTSYEAQAANVSASGVKVTSPMGGFIKSRAVNEGDYVSVGQPICTVSQNRKLQLRAEVSENYFKSLKSINNANFMTSYDNTAYRLSDLNGRLLSFGKAADGQSFYIPVTFEFDNIGDLIPGSFVTVYLLSTPQDNVISTPLSAITEEQGVYFVYLQLDDEVFKKQEVRLGEDDGTRVRVLSGLNPKDKVVSKGAYQVKLAALSGIVPEGHSHSH